MGHRESSFSATQPKSTPPQPDQPHANASAAQRLRSSRPVSSDPCPSEMSAVAFRAMHSSANSNHSSRSSEAKLLRIEFSGLHVSKEHSVTSRCDQLECQLFEAEYLADEDPILVPADIAAIVHPSQQETLRMLGPKRKGRVLDRLPLRQVWRSGFESAAERAEAAEQACTDQQ